ncbi:MAG: 4-(cytidine 5'-diphospho)-2-C-methyl-D-erythritol kinase [Clostridia bacterium]|nr:4-(cytidine 5'-diphospho)-2-C-methyl-D-erythritol kinase [Clostridia bacterium]
MELTAKAYAKINLMLDILSTLPNGYHDLFMIMQSVSLYDTITVKATKTKKIEIACNKKGIPTGEKNIVHKAATVFFNETGKENPGITIRIKKNIPQAAGLAGGSADAAATLVILNTLFEARLSLKKLAELGAEVGSDVPFCIMGGTMAAQYTGTVLSFLPNLKAENIIIVKPEQDVSTAEAYAAFDSAERVRHLDTKGMLIAAATQDRNGIFDRVDNVFEQFIDVPDRVDIKSVMRKHGCECCCMSGSGPSVFGIFEKKEDAEKCLEELKKNYNEVYLCSAVSEGCEPEWYFSPNFILNEEELPF